LDKKTSQVRIRIGAVIKRNGWNLTLCRISAGIGQPWALVCQFFPVPEGANPPKMKLFNTMARVMAGPMEFSSAIDQSRQASDHRRLFSLILEDWRIQKPVLPWCGRMHIKIVPEEAGIWWDSQPAFTKHGETTKCRERIGVEMDQGTTKKIHDGN
jgi:hypothetical protein